MQTFRVHGISVSIASSLAQVQEDAAHDFFAFKTTQTSRADLVIQTHPRADAPTDWVILSQQKRSILFRPAPQETRVEFFRNTRVRYSFERGVADVYSDDPFCAYEAVYFLFLSYTGERLDRQGLHRIHGLGLEIAGQGVLFLGASGTGKSSLALRLLNEPSIRFLSDDTPFVSQGKLFSFPQRIALREKPNYGLDHVRIFRRFEYGEKTVLGAGYFSEKICEQTDLTAIVLMKRTQANQSVFVRASRLRLILPVLNWMVLGNETPQIWELFLRPTVKSLFSKVAITGLRLKAALRLLCCAQVYELRMSTSPDETAAVVKGFRPSLLRPFVFLPKAATNN